MTFEGHIVASFAPSLRSGANDASRAANKQYALQKSCYCPIINGKHLLASWGKGKERKNTSEGKKKRKKLSPFTLSQLSNLTQGPQSVYVSRALCIIVLRS